MNDFVYEYHSEGFFGYSETPIFEYFSFAHFLPMIFLVVVSAVVCGNDDCVILGKAVNDPFDIIPACLNAVEILLSHPAAVVPRLIGVTEIDEGEVKVVLVYDLYRIVCEHLADVKVAEPCTALKDRIGERAGTGDIAKLLPGVEYRRSFTGIL